MRRTPRRAPFAPARGLAALAVAAVVGAAPGMAAAPPEALVAQQDGAEEHASLRYGREAMAAGNAVEACGHFLYALARAEDPAPVVALLLENAATAGDAGARALWVHELLRLTADEHGRADLPREWRAHLPEEDPWPEEVARTRAEALDDVLRLRERMRDARRPGARVVAEWAEDLGRRVAAEAPALLAEHGAALDPHLSVDRDLQEEVVDALATELRRADDAALRLRAARVLRGLAAQAAFQDLHGPEPPDMDREARLAGEALAEARASVAGASRTWTVEELADLSEEEIRAFTLKHASFADPGRCRSPQGWYVVESNCGWETLLGAAETVEFHHRRLANWYGEDPFTDRPGILRVVPESYGLEMEGAPFWWVGGFQSGDVTTLKFTIGTIPALGRGITHELTHRFDGAVFGGLPAWLSEGRAVWTASSYGAIEDEEFVEDHVTFGTMTEVRNMGYGRPAELENLIAGSIEEYRDNYSAGYALFVYLRSWSGTEEGGEPWYAERLQEYMAGDLRRDRGPLEAFRILFCDGADGRPADFEAFAADFDAFLAGFYWRDLAPWTARYDPGGPRGERAEVVLDEPTWTWLRDRAEPWFGQDQARVAAELLAELGRDAAAIRAYAWTLAVDEPSDATLARFADVLARAADEDAAWVVRHWRRFDAPRRQANEATPAPFLDRLEDLRAHLDALAGAAHAYAQAGEPLAAAALTADHDHLAEAVGLPPLDVAREGWRAAAEDPDRLHPFHRPERRMGLAGWGESGLTGHEDNRVEGLWFVDHRGDLHVGRDEIRGGTDTMDRAAHTRDAFAHALQWQDPGRYVISARVEFTTSFLSGGVVLGWTRRDRNLRLSFSGGDWRYAAGEREEWQRPHAVNWRLDGLWARDPGISGGQPFDGEQSTFSVELRVNGPTVELWIEDVFQGAYTTLDARPIQGHVGFYTSTGAMRVIQPTVTRLDRRQALPGAPAYGGGLHPRRPGGERWLDLLHRPVTGMPLADAGTALLWFAEESAEKRAEMEPGDWAERIVAEVDRFVEWWLPLDPAQGLTVAVPESLGADGVAAVRAAFADAVPDFAVVLHDRGERLAESAWTVGGWTSPVLGFVDPAGRLRHARRMARVGTPLTHEYRELLLRYQDHRRPGLAGAKE